MTQPQKTWTVVELLRWIESYFKENEIASPRLDAECLLAHALGLERLELYLQFDKPVHEDERAALRELVKRRVNERMPIALLTGRKEFWSLMLELTPDVLVPRPETETLVEVALEFLPDREAEYRILDVGTGSGAIALALAHERKKARVLATDVSAAALAVAKANAERLGLSDRVSFAEGDRFEPAAGQRFDLIVSNPPYLRNEEARQVAPELAQEPAGALYAGPEGTELLEALVAESRDLLATSAGFAVELAPDQAERVADWARAAGLAEVRVVKDLAGQPRVVAGRGPEAP